MMSRNEVKKQISDVILHNQIVCTAEIVRQKKIRCDDYIAFIMDLK